MPQEQQNGSSRHSDPDDPALPSSSTPQLIAASAVADAEKILRNEKLFSETLLESLSFGHPPD